MACRYASEAAEDADVMKQGGVGLLRPVEVLRDEVSLKQRQLEPVPCGLLSLLLVPLSGDGTHQLGDGRPCGLLPVFECKPREVSPRSVDRGSEVGHYICGHGVSGG